MRKILSATLILFSLILSAQQVKVVKFSEVQTLMQANSNELKVFNFWATWCGPCIKELPHFEEANGMEDVDVYLVSLDFIQDKQKVDRFVEKKSLNSPVLLLDEKDYDSYMGKVSTEWTGAIPATLFISKSGKKYFYEKPFTKAELQDKIKEYIN